MIVGAERIIGMPVFVKRNDVELAAEIVAIYSSEKEVKAYVIVKGEGSVLGVPFNWLRFPVSAAKYLKLMSISHANKIRIYRDLRDCFGCDHKFLLDTINYHLPHVFKEKKLSDYELNSIATKLREQGCEIEFV